MANYLENKSIENVERGGLFKPTSYSSEDKSTKYVYEYDSNSINFPDVNRRSWRNPDATDRHTANNSFTLKIRAESQAIYTPSFSLSLPLSCVSPW